MDTSGPRLDRWAVGMCAVGATGLTLQALRHDGVSPALYLTFDSAALCVAGALASARWPRLVWSYRAGAAGVLWSGVGWVLFTLPVLRPSSQLGWAASLTLHVALPVAVVAAHRRGRPGRRLSAAATTSLVAFPAAYLVAIMVAQAAGAPSPYPTSDAARVPLPQLLATGAAQLGGYLAAAFALRRLAGSGR